MAIDLGSSYVWVLILALGIGCFALRACFILLHGWLVEFPPIAEQALGYLPPAILAALVFSELFVPDGSLASMVVDARVLAGGVAAIVAWRTRSMMATIGVGMGVLWGITFLMG